MAKRNTAFPGDPLWLEHLRKMHPLKLMVYVGAIGISILFGFLIIGFIISGNHQYFFLPQYFTLSTIFILVSSLTMSQGVQSYELDKPKLVNRYLVATFLIGLLFIGSQMKGWKELMDKGIYFSGEVEGSYLYLLSALHLLHFFGAIAFFLFVYFRAFEASRDAVKNLMYVTDPYEAMLLNLLSICWHLMDLLWVLIYLVFLYFSW